MLPLDMPQPKRTSPLSAIPLEIREMIYKEVFLGSTAGPELLRTCRKIYAEAKKILYQRPLVFHSQSALAEWLELTQNKYHDSVTEITIHLQDVDLNSLLEPSSDTQSTSSGLRSWDLYELDLKSLQKSLARLRNINKITIRSVSDQQSFLYRKFLNRTLQIFGNVYPKLMGLSLEGNFHHQSLDFLGSMPQLQSFSFDGFSATSPDDAASIFSGLEHLTSLSLVSHHAMMTPTHHQHSTFTGKKQSFTDTVLQSMGGLSSFHLIERTVSERFSSLFFTSSLLVSLHSHSRLTSLTLNLSYTPNAEILVALEEFLGDSSIESLELDWPNLDSGVLGDHDLLPNTIKHFWIRALSLEAAHDIVLTVRESRAGGELTDLRRVVFIREQRALPSHVADTDAANTYQSNDEETTKTNFSYAARSLEVLGVKVSWYTEEARF